jgi:hypothetical protein
VIFNISQISQTLELGHARRPQIVSALDDVCHGGRHLVWVFLGVDQQVSPDCLVNRVFFLAILLGFHQLQGFRPYAIHHPPAHLWRSHGRNLAFRNLGYNGLYIY